MWQPHGSCASDLIRFVPDDRFVGTASFTYHAWDQTSGAPGGTADLNQTGGTTAFSIASESATLKVATTLVSVPEDTKSPKGDKIGSLIGLFITDPDTKAKKGIAVIGVTGLDHGAWQYYSGGGWKSLAATAANQALLLRDIDKVRFVPGPEFQGNAKIFFRAWDQTSGKAGTSVDLTLPGATGAGTAFSVDSDLAFVQVTPVNDAPLLDIGGDPPLTRVAPGATDPPGDLVSALLGSSATDADGDTIGIAIVAAAGKGTWQYQLDGSSYVDRPWQGFGQVAANTRSE